MFKIGLTGALAFMVVFCTFGQDNYEIQVYPSAPVETGITMFELHSNFTAHGMPYTDIRPTNHAFHETLEITHGLAPWAEIGFYLFTNIQSEYGWQFVGTHIRPRVSIPDYWNWPVGLSLSFEFGYQRREYSEDTWSLEIRPIIDKDTRWVYISFNPTIGKSFKGVNEKEGFDFEPNLKIAFHVNKKADLGVEYYGTTGTFSHTLPVQEQVHALYAALDLFVSKNWEFNFGTGWGLTDATDGLVFKVIIGRRIGGRKPPDPTLNDQKFTTR